MKVYALNKYNEDPSCDDPDYNSRVQLAVYPNIELARKVLEIEASKPILETDYCQLFELSIEEIEIFDSLDQESSDEHIIIDDGVKVNIENQKENKNHESEK